MTSTVKAVHVTLVSGCENDAVRLLPRLLYNISALLDLKIRHFLLKFPIIVPNRVDTESLNKKSTPNQTYTVFNDHRRKLYQLKGAV